MANAMDATKFAAQVLAGQHDDRLNDLKDAVLIRAKKVGFGSRWKFTLDGIEVTEDDLTLEECVQIEQDARIPWTLLQPNELATQAKALAKAVLVSRGSFTEDEATERVKKLTAIEAADMFSIYFVEPSPIDNPDPS